VLANLEELKDETLSEQEEEVAEDVGRRKYETDNVRIDASNGHVEKSKVDFSRELKKTMNGADSRPNFNLAEIKKEKSLTAGLSTERLKLKYKSDNVALTERDYQIFDAENEDNLFSKNAITNALNERENAEAFNEDKIEALEEDIPKEETKMKGWGSWTGFGVREREVDAEKEAERVRVRIVAL
jgi:hypothetical protein